MRRLSSFENLIIFIIVLFGFLVRVIPFLDILKETPQLFYQPDNSYYIRRVLTIIHNFPKIPMADIYLSYPKLSEFPSPPFYPLFLSLMSFIFGLGSVTEHTIELTSSFLTALFGGLVALPIYLFAKRVMKNQIICYLCSFVGTFISLHYWYTLAVAGDHHAVEVFFAMMSFYFLSTQFNERTKSSRLYFIIFTLGLFLIWQGAILYLIIMSAYTFFYCLYKKEWDIFYNFGTNTLITAFLLLFFNILIPPQEEFISYGRYSFFSFFSVLLISLFYLFMYYSINKKLTGTLVSGIIVVALLFLLKEEMLKGFLFISKKEKGFIAILEMKSILDIKFWSGKINLEFFRGLNYYYYLLFPPFLLIFLYWDRRDYFVYTLFLIVCFALLSYNQRRFGYIYGPFIVISFFYLWDRTLQLKKGILGILLVLPVVVGFVEGVLITRNIFDSIIDREIRNAFFWIRKNTPQASKDVFDWKTLPDYTVYVPWYHGYYLVHIAQRPVFTNNALLVSNQEGFIDSVKISITSHENVFRSLLDKYKVRYIVIPGISREYDAFKFINYPYIEPYQRIYGILFFFDGKYGENYLGNYRLIGDFINPKDGRRRSKIFEYVKGANLKCYVGNSKEASILIKVKGPFQKILFTQKYKAGNDGYVNFKIPYSSGVQGMSFVESSVLNFDGKEIPLYISEEAVFHGKSYEINLTKADHKRIEIN